MKKFLREKLASPKLVISDIALPSIERADYDYDYDNDYGSSDPDYYEIPSEDDLENGPDKGSRSLSTQRVQDEEIKSTETRRKRAFILTIPNCQMNWEQTAQILAAGGLTKGDLEGDVRDCLSEGGEEVISALYGITFDWAKFLVRCECWTAIQILDAVSTARLRGQNTPSLQSAMDEFVKCLQIGENEVAVVMGKNSPLKIARAVLEAELKEMGFLP